MMHAPMEAASQFPLKLIQIWGAPNLQRVKDELLCAVFAGDLPFGAFIHHVGVDVAPLQLCPALVLAEDHLQLATSRVMLQVRTRGRDGQMQSVKSRNRCTDSKALFLDPINQTPA